MDDEEDSCMSDVDNESKEKLNTWKVKLNLLFCFEALMIYKAFSQLKMINI